MYATLRRDAFIAHNKRNKYTEQVAQSFINIIDASKIKALFFQMCV